MSRTPLRCGDRTFVLGERTLVMGIVNVTPDSFSDGGAFLDPDSAYDQSMRLLEAGADVLDLGAESTRPGAVPVDADEEARRLLPVLDRLVEAGVRCTSVDTSKPSVARLALAHGAAWINDVSGLADADLAAASATADALVVMHQRPMTPGRADDRVAYDDLLGEVTGRLQELVERAVAAGVPRERVIVDPGIGFGKTIADNLRLLARIGADIVRVHRVDGVRHALSVVDAVRRSGDVP